jgi:hypothetical protein
MFNYLLKYGICFESIDFVELTYVGIDTKILSLSFSV